MILKYAVNNQWILQLQCFDLNMKAKSSYTGLLRASSSRHNLISVNNFANTMSRKSYGTKVRLHGCHVVFLGQDFKTKSPNTFSSNKQDIVMTIK